MWPTVWPRPLAKIWQHRSVEAGVLSSLSAVAWDGPCNRPPPATLSKLECGELQFNDQLGSGDVQLRIGPILKAVEASWSILTKFLAQKNGHGQDSQQQVHHEARAVRSHTLDKSKETRSMDAACSRKEHQQIAVSSQINILQRKGPNQVRSVEAQQLVCGLCYIFQDDNYKDYAPDS